MRNKVRQIKESIAGGRRAYYALPKADQARVHNAAWVLFEAGITAGNAEAKADVVHEGFVYIISNPAWPNHVKIGCAMNPERRLEGFNTGAPLRDYKIEHTVFSSNRLKAEAYCHSKLDRWRAQGEWFRVSPGFARLVLRGIEESV